jgi:hypothetical protein
MRTASVTIKQTVLLIGVVVVLVFLVTYATTVLRPTENTNIKTPSSAAAGSEMQLAFASAMMWPAPTSDKPEPLPAPWEWQAAGQHDFWFQNNRDDPVQVAVNAVGCASCTRVELCVLPEDLKRMKPDQLDAHAQDPGLTWQVLSPQDSKGVTVPAHAAGGVRLHWQKKERASGPQTISAELETESHRSVGQSITLRVGLAFVDPVMIAAEENLKEASKGSEISVGALLAGDVKTVNLLCFSLTRSAFKVKAEAPADPCITCGTPEAFTAEECRSASSALPTPILCAYRVPVTVRERTDDGKQLDLGRFRRHVQFTSDAVSENGDAVLTGTVRGDIMVGTVERERDLLLLGSFERSVGTTKEITLTTEQANLNLEVESKPEFLTAELHEEKGAGVLGKTWTLSVTVPPDALDGSIPPHTYVVLKTKGAKPRRVNIPVIGLAYVR